METKHNHYIVNGSALCGLHIRSVARYTAFAGNVTCPMCRVVLDNGSLPESKRTMNQVRTFQSRIDLSDYGYKRPGKIVAEVRHDDRSENGHNTFSITSDITGPGGRFIACGQLREDFDAHFPELVPLYRWHLVSTAGPLHYFANTIYNASDRDCFGKAGAKVPCLEMARESALWPDGTLEQLRDRATLAARLPALMREFKGAVESFGFTY